MTISVKSYTKHVNGKVVTVHGYDANRDQLLPVSSPHRTGVVREHVNRNESRDIAPSGQYRPANPNSGLQGLGGLTAYLYKPGSPQRDLPVYKWRRTIFPKRGLYKIPKKESGNV